MFEMLCKFLFLLCFSGCSQLSYYTQSVRGQLDVWRREAPIEEVIERPATRPELKEKLALALRIREYASRELALPQNDSYRRYADLQRPYIVWNVFAAPEFSVKPVQWCFVMAGCVSYRGYFAKADANAFAANAAQQGHDVRVAGVPAYSTLGWFADPVLNTFVDYPPAELARLVFHELAHQVVYVKDDTVFNESFAVAVEREGLKRWLAAHGSDADRDTQARMRRYRSEFVALVQARRAKLDALYARGGAPDELRAAKRASFAEMRTEYEALKAGWGGYAGYDRWFEQPPNNALLASVNLYTQRVAAFEALLREHGHDLSKFYAAVKALARMDKSDRDAALARYEAL
jgi:predicted aminopeptidase